MDIDSSSKPGLSAMMPLAAGLLGVLLGVIALFMSFSNSGKVAAMKADVDSLMSTADTMKATASDVASVKQKVDLTASKLDAVVSGVQSSLTNFGQDVSAKITAISDKVDKLGSRAPVAAAAGGSKSAPAETAVTSAGGTHTIVAGDTLAVLARKYNVTLAAIVAANPGVDPSKLKIGQSINIPPAKASSTSPTPAPRSPPTSSTTPASTPASTVTQ